MSVRETNKLSQAEMEDELDRCPAPWRCPRGCYAACRGCVRKQRQRRKNATRPERRAERGERPATSAQLRQIDQLARATGLRIDPQSITSAAIADRVIFQLAVLERRVKDSRWL